MEDVCKLTFIPELINLKELEHPNIIKMYESFGDGESGSVLILEYCNGKNLAD